MEKPIKKARPDAQYRERVYRIVRRIPAGRVGGPCPDEWAIGRPEPGRGLRDHRQQCLAIRCTIEGDPISYSLALQSSDRIDVLIGSRDRYSPMGTFAYVCTGLVRDAANAEPGRFHLIATACAGPPAFLDGTRLTIR